MVKRGLVLLWLLVLLSAVGGLFWYNDWVYQLPTPVPENYKPVKTGTVVTVNELAALPLKRPVLLHFFNPDCPCSRFNKAHFRSLVRQYGQQVNFAVVVMSAKPYSAQEIQEKLELDIPVLFDPSIARSCGVYSTPQAVLLDAQHRLYYRGNYNRTRYCTDEKTSYAKMALAGLLQNESGRVFDQFALTSYGCTLPYCKK
ncbi:peroxiredoxin family protein [Larkinella terrae]|uniref:Redoxin domain-containing protein n=1 Tax=Larkinella terrae TaxID=2025311 RepID=A0A7K0ESB2_9BACT|nr:thioredoxin fold domain-containing protein [Larkinella terrae]MRS64426.1 redoxin domain-containing protein [Larkinella terrae]